MPDRVKVAIIQEGPEYLNLEASLEKLEKLVGEAAKNGANLVVVGEGWLSGYPVWFDHCPETALWDHEPVKEVFAQFFENSVSIEGKEVQHLGQLAKKHQIVLSIGVNEKIETGTLFNSLLLFNSDGTLLNHHRKLVPTFTEKLVHNHGDGAGLKASNTTTGRIGGLICWEHWMPLSRQTMHDSFEQIHIAVWPTVHEMHQVACRSYAFEGRCFVIGAGQVMKANELPKSLKLPAHLEENLEENIMKGGSCVVAPNGSYVLEPVYDKAEMLYAELDLKMVTKEKMNLDTSGHYQRKDIYNLEVNRERKF